MRDDRTPVAFVGLGRIASLLEDDPRREKPATHAGAVASRHDCRIAGGYDRDPDRCRAFARRWNTRTYDRFDDMLSGEAPGIVVIATHPDSHEYYLRRSVRAGVPVVVCEKPVAHSRAAARRMATIERRGPTRVVVNHERRFSADYRLVRDAVRGERFGALRAVTARLYFGRTARHDQVFMHDGTHLLDAINFLTDDRVRLTRRVGRYRSRVSSVFLHGRTARRRLPVAIEIGAGHDYLDLVIDLTFEGGEIRVGNGIFEWRVSRESPFYSGYRSLQSLRRNVPEPTGYFAGMIAEAVRLFHDPSAVSGSRIADGEAVVREIRRAGWLL